MIVQGLKVGVKEFSPGCFKWAVDGVELEVFKASDSPFKAEVNDAIEFAERQMFGED